MRAEKQYLISKNEHYRDTTDNPLFYISLVAILIGFMLFLTGFVAELVARNGSDRNNYQIAEEV